MKGNQEHCSVFFMVAKLFLIFGELFGLLSDAGNCASDHNLQAKITSTLDANFTLKRSGKPVQGPGREEG